MIRKKDLEYQTGMIGCRHILLCEGCWSSYSANREDYWLENEEHVFRCDDPDCEGRPMVLAVPEVQDFTVVKR